MRRWMQVLVDVRDQADQVDTADMDVEVDTRLLGKEDPAEIQNLGDQLAKDYHGDMNYPPIQEFRVRGVDPLHISEECDDADERPWWKYR